MLLMVIRRSKDSSFAYKLWVVPSLMWGLEELSRRSEDPSLAQNCRFAHFVYLGIWTVSEWTES